MVEAFCDVPGQLHVLLLVAAHGDEVGLVQQNIGGHQGGIGEQTAVDVVGILGGFVLELGHAGQFAEHGIAVQHPAQLRVGGDVGLDEQRILLGVQSAGDILGQLLQRAAAQLDGVLPHGDRVHVCHKVVVIKFIGALHPVFDGPQIRSQGQIAAGLDAGEHYLFFVHVSWLLFYL